MNTKGIVLSSRIRLARNIEGYPFFVKGEKAAELIRTVYDGLKKIDRFTFYKMSALSDIMLVAMMERRLISQDLIKNRDFAAAAVSQDESVSIMIGEEDHLREQCILKGLSLKEAYSKASLIDRTLGGEIKFAFDPALGYLTSCLTNVGTGMRASVMMFLPALTLTQSLEDCLGSVARLNMAVRGFYGEGSESSGFIYQISNQRTLGIPEKLIILSVESAANHIMEAETRAREFLIKTDPCQIKDRILRSFGLLTNSYKLSHGEFINLVAFIKLGLFYGILCPKSMAVRNLSGQESTADDALEELIMEMGPANISAKRQDMAPLERDILRAEIVGREINKMFERS